VRLVQLPDVPPKGDVTDYLRSHPKEALLDLIKATKPFASAPKTQEALIKTMDEIAAERVDWLWTNRIPIGRLTLIDGDPSSGKSYLSLAIAAAVSRGEPLPFDTKTGSAGNILLISCEDGYADTVRPRLDQLGANVSRIAIPNPSMGLVTTVLSADLLERMVKTLGPALVIIDPIIAFAGRKNTEKAGEVRDLLSPLMVLAEKHLFAALVVRHFTKQEDRRALYRGGGSVDFMAACRSAFIIVESDDEPDKRVLAHVKNSLGPKSRSLGFYIDANGFRWGEQMESDADELLAAQRDNNRKREKKELNAAEQFIRETLAAGPIPSNEIFKKAEAAGISRSTLFRAKETLHVKASKAGMSGGWTWQPPAEFFEDTQTLAHAHEM
jgi:RecA-family ATPase